MAEGEDRIIISHDKRTLGDHLADHLAAGRHSPGILVLRPGRLSDLGEYLVMVAFASDAAEWRDQLRFVP